MMHLNSFASEMSEDPGAFIHMTKTWPALKSFWPSAALLLSLNWTEPGLEQDLTEVKRRQKLRPKIQSHHFSLIMSLLSLLSLTSLVSSIFLEHSNTLPNQEPLNPWQSPQSWPSVINNTKQQIQILEQSRGDKTLQRFNSTWQSHILGGHKLSVHPVCYIKEHLLIKCIK